MRLFHKSQLRAFRKAVGKLSNAAPAETTYEI